MLNIVMLIVSMLALSCSIDPVPLNWGQDQCDHCRMTIVDNKFGAEIVTKKGKIYKFDAVECMANFMKDGKIQQNEISKCFVIDASNPAQFIDAENATYLISENFPSPMGADLSAYGSRSDAEKSQANHKGDLRTWDDIKAKFKLN